MGKNEDYNDFFSHFKDNPDIIVNSNPEVLDLRPLISSRDLKAFNKKGFWIWGVHVSSLDLTAFAIIVSSICWWFIYVTRLIAFSNLWFFGGILTAVLIFLIFRSYSQYEIKMIELKSSHFKNNAILKYNIGLVENIIIGIIAFLIVDIFFETHLLGLAFQIPDGVSSITTNLILCLSLVMVNCFVKYLFNIHLPLTNDSRKRPLIIFITSAVFLIFVTVTRIRAGYIDPELFPTGMIGFSDIMYKAMFFPLFPGQYGGASAFGQIWEISFYNIYAGTILAIMLIATFANIFFINQNKVPAIQSLTTVGATGVPLIMVVMMLIGLIPPPGPLLQIFILPVITSFVYAIVVGCVFVIYLCFMMTFTQAAEVFNPED